MTDDIWTDGVIAGIQEVARVLWSIAALLAPWLVPLAPAIFFGWTIYETAVKATMDPTLAGFAAVAAAVGLETVNIAANHAMLRLSHNFKEHGGKFALSIFFILVYVTIGVVAMFLLDVTDSVKVIGIGMFLLAPVAIGAQALTMDLVQVKDEGRKREEVEADERAWRREQARLKTELEYQERLARIEANTQVRLVRERVKADQVAVNLPSTSRQLPDWLPVIPDNLDDFRRLVADGTITVAGITGADLAEYIPVVGSDSTGRYWLRQARNGNH